MAEVNYAIKYCIIKYIFSLKYISGHFICCEDVKISIVMLCHANKENKNMSFHHIILI